MAKTKTKQTKIKQTQTQTKQAKPKAKKAGLTARAISILKVLVKNGTTSGIDIIRKLDSWKGVVYPSLWRLEEQGLVRSKRIPNPARGPELRVYTVTAAGTKASEAEAPARKAPAKKVAKVKATKAAKTAKVKVAKAAKVKVEKSAKTAKVKVAKAKVKAETPKVRKRPAFSKNANVPSNGAETATAEPAPVQTASAE